MKSIESVQAARLATANYALGAGAEIAPMREMIAVIMSKVSPVDQIVSMAELLYARRSSLGDEGRELAAGLAEFAARHGWHGLGQDGRGDGMVSALRRDLGEAAPVSGWPDPESDPASLAEYLPVREMAPVEPKLPETGEAAS